MRILVTIALILLALPLWAQALKLGDVKSHPTRFLSGVAAGVLAYELGHVIVANSERYSVDVAGGSLIYSGPPMSPAQRVQISSAGFQTQWLLSEAILRDHEARHPGEPMDPAAAGVVCSHLLISAAYLTVLRDNLHGDLRAVNQATGRSTSELATMITLPALLDYWRLTARDVPAWVPTVSATSKGVGIGACWRF